MNEQKIDRIIELLEQINNKLESSTSRYDEVMQMNAAEFVKQNHCTPRLRNSIVYHRSRTEDDLTVRQVYDMRHINRIRNFGKKSLKEFRELVDYVIDN